MDLLGGTLEEIAREKAGIFKRDVPAVVGEARVDIRTLLEKCAIEAGSAPVIVLDDEYTIHDIRVSSEGTSFRVDNGSRVTTPLIGAHQARNTVIALATVRALYQARLPASSDAIANARMLPLSEVSAAISKTFLPGRFQRIGKFIFDVAHNPDGARTVSDTVVALPLVKPIFALHAVLADKDWRGIMRALAPVVDRLILTHAPSAPPERRWIPEKAAEFARTQGISASLVPDFDRAVDQAEKTAGTVLVTGSFHTVGDVMSRLQVSPFAA
jgi:dihydrofolate synthase/folylpolyglutamate synthase